MPGAGFRPWHKGHSITGGAYAGSLLMSLNLEGEHFPTNQSQLIFAHYVPGVPESILWNKRLIHSSCICVLLYCLVFRQWCVHVLFRSHHPSWDVVLLTSLCYKDDAFVHVVVLTWGGFLGTFPVGNTFFRLFKLESRPSTAECQQKFNTNSISAPWFRKAPKLNRLFLSWTIPASFRTSNGQKRAEHVHSSLLR